jgi:hypothetical protein
MADPYKVGQALLSIINPVVEAASEYEKDYEDDNNDTDEAEPAEKQNQKQ